MKIKIILSQYSHIRDLNLQYIFRGVLALCLSNLFVLTETYAQVEGSFPSGQSSSGMSCGSIINESIELSANLVCNEHGLIVNASDVSIAMNGYSIIGPGIQSTKSGIIVPNLYNVTIYGPGRVIDFQSGIFVSGSNKSSISSVFLDKNRIGVYLTGSFNSDLEGNMFMNNELGIAAHSSSDIRSNENYFYGNSLAGVSFINTINSSITLNYVNGSQNGLFTDPSSSSTAISFNFLRNIIDINSANGLANDITNNTYKGNYCELSLPSGICRGVTD